MTFNEKKGELDWALPLLHKHTPEVMTILGQLISAGLAREYCTLNDVQTVHPQKGLVGAVMKLLKCLGFEHSTKKIPDTRPGRKGTVSVWILKDKAACDAYLEYQLRYFTVVMHKREEDLCQKNCSTSGPC